MDDFPYFFAKWGTFCNFLLKSWPRRGDIVVCSKNLHILAKSAIFMFFCEIKNFLQFLLKSWPKRWKMVVCSKELNILAKLTISHAFSRSQDLLGTLSWKGDPNDERWWFARKTFTVLPNRRFLMLFCEIGLFLHFFAEKLTQTPTHGGLPENFESFGQIDDFPCFSAKWDTFCKFLLKSSPKRWNVVVCSRRFYILAKSTIFHAFSLNEAPFATFCWKDVPNVQTGWFPRKTCKL